MADALRITPATEADGEALAALNRAFNEVEISGPAQAARLRETAAHERAFLAWVGDVAVGFTSLGSFSWLFRRSVGLAPAEYRPQTR